MVFASTFTVQNPNRFKKKFSRRGPSAEAKIMSAEYERPTSSVSPKPGVFSSTVPLLSDVEATAVDDVEKAPVITEREDIGTVASSSEYKLAFSHFLVRRN